jgi:membrane protease YdiL (CAAX protease family)
MNFSNWIFLIICNGLLFFILKFNDDLKQKKIIDFISIQQIKLYLIIASIFLFEYYFIDNENYSMYAPSIRSSIISLYSYFICKKYFNTLFKSKVDLKIILIIALVSLVYALLILNLQEYLFYLGNRKLLVNYGVYLLNYKILIICIFYTTLPAIFEEFFFRGLIFDKLKLIYSPNKSIIISSILFCLIHLIYGSFVLILFIFPISIFLGYIRNRYNNLFYPIVAHFIYNFVIILYPLIK